MTARRPPRRIGLAYNPSSDEARDLALRVEALLASRGVDTWMTDLSQERDHDRVAASDLVMCFGGDGTVLRCARLAIEAEPLILGVNMGRLGFLTELESFEVEGRLDEVLAGGGRIEERALLQASVPGSGEVFHALNEIVIGRATLSRAIQLAVDVDSVRIADYRCDGVIVATATGSTAYALSVGGPILPPESHDIVVVPVAPHLAAQHAVVLAETEVVHVTLEPRQQAVLSVDGESDLELHEHDTVVARISPYHARFLRFHDRTDFYLRMAARLGWHRPAGKAEPLPRRLLS
ncbi:MAG TPA: NAD(+)/NADH kinase [Dehalococcoidia bacterium]|nr:NAD(+)/NADH kinase [Dehalococcoidia bacterium]